MKFFTEGFIKGVGNCLPKLRMLHNLVKILLCDAALFALFLIPITTATTHPFAKLFVFNGSLFHTLRQHGQSSMLLLHSMSL